MTIQTEQSYHLQELQRRYAENALLPDLDWRELFQNSLLSSAQLAALNTLYQHAVPLALNIFKQLDLDVFDAPHYHPQGLGLFAQLAQQEEHLIYTLAEASQSLEHESRHQLWSMLLRGGAVLVFQAWLGWAKTGYLSLDLKQFDEISDLLWIKTQPLILAEQLHVDAYANLEHSYLIYEDNVFLDKFNCVATAKLFSQLGVCDPIFLCLRDEKLAELLIADGTVQASQIEELQCALNPLHCNLPMIKHEYLI